MVKNLLLITLILLSLVLTSCGMGSSGSIDVDVIENYRKGSDGLRLKFIRENPPSEILEDSLFAIGVEVHNDGATDVDDVLMTLNYDNDYIKLNTNPEKSFSLAGRSSFNPDGELRNYFFDSQSLFLDRESSRRTIPLLASVCYSYDTVLTENVCIGRSYDSGLETGDAVCDVKDHSYSGQGGPVVITSVKTNVVNSEVDGAVKPVFDIEIEHSGNGVVTNPGHYQLLCSNSFGYSGEMNTVEIVEATLSDKHLACKTNTPGHPGIITLKDGYARIRCTSLNDVNEYMMPFQSQFALKLNYGYMQTESMKMELVR